MKKEKLLKSLLVLIIGLASLVLLPAPQAQASSVTYCIDPANCPGNQRYSVRLNPTQRQRDQLYAGYINSRNQMSKPGAGMPVNQAVTRRMAATAALSWALLIGGLLALASSLRAWLTQGRRRQRSRTRGWRWASPALASALGFLLVLSAMLGTTFTSTGKSVLAAEPVQGGSTGTFTAAQEIGGAGITQIGGIVYDSAGNYYVTGGFTGSLSFATSPVTTLTSTQDYDVFVAKFNASNQCLWARQANGASGVTAGLSLDGAVTVAIDQSGNCYLGGGFVKMLSFKADNGSTLAQLTASGSGLNFEPFVAKYDPNGTLQWARGGQSGSPQHTADLKTGFNSIVKIVLDGTGNPYAAGSFSGTSFLGQAVSAHGQSDALLAKLNPANGNPVWVSLPGGSAEDTATALAIDAHSNLYLAGATKGIATFPTQPAPTQVGEANTVQDGFVAKYTSSGACLWVSQIKGEPLVLVHDLVVNAAGETFLTGAFINQAQFVGSSYTLSEYSTLANGYVAKLATDGVAIYAQGFGDGFFASGRRILLDGAGGIYVGGNFANGAHFGSEQVNAQDLATPNGTDQFIARYKPELDNAFRFQWAKAILGTGEESPNLITSENVTATTNPMQMFYDPTTGKIKLAGDTNGTIDFDGIPVDANAASNEPDDELSEAHGPFSFDPATPSIAEETRHVFIATFVPPPPPPPPPVSCESKCPTSGPPVCDLVTGMQYANACFADCAGVQVQNYGPCPPANRPPVAQCKAVTVSAGANGKADASINNGSSDPDNDSITLSQSPAGPYSVGTTSVTLTVTDSKGATSQCTANVTVLCPPITFSPASLAAGRINTPYSQTIMPSNGAAPFTFSVTGLPSGLTTNATATNLTLSGIPTLAGSFTVNVNVTDGFGCPSSKSYPLIINPPLLLPGDRRFFGDFDGDGRTDLAVWRLSTATFWVYTSAIGTTLSKQWGVSTDVPVPSDYDGDGKTDFAVWRPATGAWLICFSSNGTSPNWQWGFSTDVPVPGDYDGDGKTDLAVFRPSTGVWWIYKSSTGATITIQWGNSTDTPMPGDYDGDGKTDFTVWRSATATFWVYSLGMNTSFTKQLGVSTDVPVPSDYDGDGKTDFAVWRPATGVWTIANSSNGVTMTGQWGGATDVPTPGDYDGDGKTDLAIWRPATGVWWIFKSSNGGTVNAQWGMMGDVPVS